MATILVVDDDAQIVALVTLALERAGHRVLSALSGQQAIECARREQPQLVLLDLIMPGMSGGEVLDQMRTDPELARIPVVLATGESYPEVEHGSVAVLNKPYKLDELYQMVQRLVGDDRPTGAP